jgi:hypothetical protein
LLPPRQWLEKVLKTMLTQLAEMALVINNLILSPEGVEGAGVQHLLSTFSTPILVR